MDENFEVFLIAFKLILTQVRLLEKISKNLVFEKLLEHN